MSRRSSMLRSALLWVLLWTGLGLFFASEAAIRQYPGSERNIPWAAALAVNIPFYLAWGVLALGVLRLARLFPIAGDRRRRARNILIHAVASVAVATLHLALAEGLFELIRIWRGMSVNYLDAVIFSFRHNIHINLLTYWAIVALRHLREYDRGLREKELMASRLEEQLARAELSALRMQLQPHFLFNALNSISSLVYDRPELADQMLVRLSDLLRQSLETSGQQEIPLEQELDFVACYLEIESMRYPDRLEVDRHVDPLIVDAAVPAFVLQPLVENAVVHGVGRSSGPCKVILRAWREDEELILEVENDHPDATGRGPAPGGSGVGIQNTRARLEQLYGGRARLELDLRPGRRALARVFLPFRELGASRSVH